MLENIGELKGMGLNSGQYGKKNIWKMQKTWSKHSLWLEQLGKNPYVSVDVALSYKKPDLNTLIVLFIMLENGKNIKYD